MICCVRSIDTNQKIDNNLSDSVLLSQLYFISLLLCLKLSFKYMNVWKNSQYRGKILLWIMFIFGLNHELGVAQFGHLPCLLEVHRYIVLIYKTKPLNI